MAPGVAVVDDEGGAGGPVEDLGDEDVEREVSEVEEHEVQFDEGLHVATLDLLAHRTHAVLVQVHHLFDQVLELVDQPQVPQNVVVVQGLQNEGGQNLEALLGLPLLLGPLELRHLFIKVESGGLELLALVVVLVVGVVFAGGVVGLQVVVTHLGNKE